MPARASAGGEERWKFSLLLYNNMAFDSCFPLGLKGLRESIRSPFLLVGRQGNVMFLAQLRRNEADERKRYSEVV
jgi:hypothetical protein